MAHKLGTEKRNVNANIWHLAIIKKLPQVYSYRQKPGMYLLLNEKSRFRFLELQFLRSKHILSLELLICRYTLQSNYVLL